MSAIVLLYPFQCLIAAFLLYRLVATRTIGKALILYFSAAVGLSLASLLFSCFSARAADFLAEVARWVIVLPTSISFMPLVPGLEVSFWIYAWRDWPITEGGRVWLAIFINIILCGIVWFFVRGKWERERATQTFVLVYGGVLAAYWVSLNLYPRCNLLLFSYAKLPFIRPIR